MSPLVPLCAGDSSLVTLWLLLFDLLLLAYNILFAFVVVVVVAAPSFVYGIVQLFIV